MHAGEHRPAVVARRPSSGRKGGCPVGRGASCPFSGPSLTVLAQWSHRAIDISAEANYLDAPEAVKVIHDRYYSTPPASFRELRWRLQHIAEEELGKYVRQEHAAEEVAAREMVSKLG